MRKKSTNQGYLEIIRFAIYFRSENYLGIKIVVDEWKKFNKIVRQDVGLIVKRAILPVILSLEQF